MRPFSSALELATDATGCPIAAAFAVSRQSNTFLSEESRSAALIDGAHRLWPELGASVRTLRRSFVEKLEELGLLPKVKSYQTKYRREVHVSLWKIITDLHDKRRWSKREIVALLQEGGV